MTRRLMPAAGLALFVLLASAAPRALAEGITWAFEIHPGLDVVMNAGENAPIHSQKGADFVRTVFVIQGTGPQDWTEMFDVLYTRPKNEPKNVKLWYEAMQGRTKRACELTWAVLKEAKGSLTWERRAAACGDDPAENVFGRVVYGKHNVFSMMGRMKGEVTAEDRERWLKLLASAQIMR